jgi:transcriptional regulator with XRE-family HTH domain
VQIEGKQLKFCKSASVENSRMNRNDLQLPAVTQGRKNPLWMSTADRLDRLRKAAAIRVIDLANLSGVAQSMICNYSARVHIPKLNTVEKIAAGLGVSPIYLAFGPEGAEPFRLKTPAYLKSDEEPQPRPGAGVFAERYRGCAERLKSSRERLGLSLRELATAATVSYQAVLNTESGQTVPRVDTIEAIAVALDVAPGWLAYGDDE